MQLGTLDWIIVAAYFAASLAIALYFTRRAGASSEEFFTAKGSLNWFLAGTSMVATTFAADTPLSVTEIVATKGIAGNWLWWNMVFGGMITVFFYARLWKRSGVQTDIELTELRYAGRSAAFLRGFRAVYLAIPFNCLVIGWVNRAMVDILTVCFFPEQLQGEADTVTSLTTQCVLVLVCFLMVGGYSLLSGLWGVIFTDAFQFVLAMAGCIALAFIVVGKAGGMSGVEAQLAVQYGEQGRDNLLRLIPAPDSPWMPLPCFLVMLAVPWWSAWYPGSEPGGGAFVAQRMLSAKDERHSFFATLWFYIAHFALRPWPWIFAALAGMVLYAGRKFVNPGHMYPQMIVDLPPGLRGLLLTAFLAAYMSTISTLLNWGASYLVNDVYRRFLRPGRDERHYVGVGRLATVLIMLCGGVSTFFFSSIPGAWKFVLLITAGTGGVYMLRWYWWRINAWSEISAMVVGFLAGGALFFRSGLNPADDVDFASLLVAGTGVTTAAWLAVTYVTRPEPRECLERFYRKIRPGGPGWGPVAAACPEVRPDPGWGGLWLQWALSCALVLGALFGVGESLLGRHGAGAIWLSAAGLSGFVLWRLLERKDAGAGGRG